MQTLAEQGVERKYVIEIIAKITKSCVLPALIYGAQTWATTKKEENKLRATHNQNTTERSILGIKRKDKEKIQQ